MSFIFLFRIYGKRAAPELVAALKSPPVAKTNDYDYYDGDHAAYPEYRNGPTAEYVQLFS